MRNTRKQRVSESIRCFCFCRSAWSFLLIVLVVASLSLSPPFPPLSLTNSRCDWCFLLLISISCCVFPGVAGATAGSSSWCSMGLRSCYLTRLRSKQVSTNTRGSGVWRHRTLLMLSGKQGFPVLADELLAPCRRSRQTDLADTAPKMPDSQSVVSRRFIGAELMESRML